MSPQRLRKSGRLPRILLPILALTLSVAPACSSTASGPQREGLGARLADRLAYRPVYPTPPDAPKTRPLYLSGYAGAYYGPPAPPNAYDPTGYTVGAGHRHGFRCLLGHHGD